VSGSNLYVVNVVLAVITFASIVYLVACLLQGYSSKQRELLSAYLASSVALLLLLVVTLVELLLSNELVFWIFLDRVRYIGFIFMDNFVVFFSMIAPSPVKQTTLKSVLLALFISLVHVGLLFLFDFIPCGACALIYPAPEVIYSYLFSSLFYMSLIVLSCISNAMKARAPGQAWTQFLCIFNLAFMVSGVVTAHPTDSGFCLNLGANVLYRLLYVPILYHTFIADSEQVLSDKMFDGDADMMQDTGDALFYYRHKLSRLDTPVKTIDFEDLYFGPKIGAWIRRSV